MDRSIQQMIIVPASIDQVWTAWTTEAGARTFFAPDCRIKLKPGGAYEMLFNLEASPGEQGGEGMLVLAVQPPELLSFTWNAPPSLPDVRGMMTHVTVRFEKLSPAQTRVNIIHDGWGAGGQWDQAFEYFQRAWGEVVLPRLKHRFEKGPIDWNNLPARGDGAA